MKTIRMLLTCFFLCLGGISIAQNQFLDTANLIPNGSFEEFSGFPLGWYFKGSHYTQLVRFWSSPTATSPDAYGPNVLVPEGWKKNGFGEARPYHGKAMSGITLYGCESGKPHCREYLQVPLIEPLIIGQSYTIRFRYLHLDRSLALDNLGIQFNDKPIELKTESVLNSEGSMYMGNILICKRKSWGLFEYSFTATEPHQYIVIGNFESDDLTSVQPVSDNPLPFAYYYIDGVELRKKPPIVPSQNDIILLKNREIKKGGTVQLENIYFDLDKTDFHPKSFGQLNELYELMCLYPNMVIVVRGHTDDQGSANYNKNLSENRAKAVAHFLLDHGIHYSRIKFTGFGSDLPIGDNTTMDGRHINRRVEFIILGL